MTNTFDYLVIGSGIAGLSFALDVADHGSVAIITKKQDNESNTNYAQGGIAAVVGQQDRLEWHIEDTLSSGAGLCHRDAVELLVRTGSERIEQLRQWGAEFSTTFREGKLILELHREGGHRINRIVHRADFTGQEVERALVERAQNHPNIQLFEHHALVELLTQHQVQSPEVHNRCFGAYVYDSVSNYVETFLAKITVLATGGCGQVWRHTTNPAIATGDGLAAAARAGARIANLEFMQFHPTALHSHESPAFLISEAVRGYGAKLLNRAGERFMLRYHPDGELATRDIVARAIDAEMKLRGDEFVLLDVTHMPAPETRERFPHIDNTLHRLGINMTEQPIPVVPAAHYMCGGVVTDLHGQTSIAALFAIGEVAMTGVHGANRLASNSLLEALVFAHTTAAKAIEACKQFEININVPEWDAGGTIDPEEWILISHDREEIRELMADYVGIVKSGLRLERARRRIALIRDEIREFWKRTTVTLPLLELRNIALVGQLAIECSSRRLESRGLHYRTDYPATSPAFANDTLLDRGALELNNRW
ncbi:MAG: L-aspartate oxidase [bacterium]|nr:L-aspartate oxidase [bacterium]